ncbi:DUF4352 domain-containing protein [Paenibacillus albicereus]|uniref:DUF4352 domain-containing protein n=1 Tax=Paenibacillus albicereus TaxID=2726185 RepID=A0A6H2GYS8_9BACL|nr:DUF4352 domain-containing protein [Paenibacillus albicereus]QJC52593.1 DUF4352 domain-containing protein [Paenibacillus albicereus]
MKKVFKLGCLGFVGLFVIIIIIGMVASKDDSPTTANQSGEAAQTAANTGGEADKKEEAKKEEAAPAEPVMAKIGEELQVGDVVFKVNKTRVTKEIKNGEYFVFKPDAEGSAYYVVNVTITNKGKETIQTDSSFFKLLKDEIEYSPTSLLGADGFFMYDGINPGLSQTGNVAFEIPETLKDFVLNVQTGFWGTEQGQIKLAK